MFTAALATLSGSTDSYFLKKKKKKEKTYDGRFVTATRSILLLKIKISCSSFSAVWQHITVTPFFFFFLTLV